MHLVAVEAFEELDDEDRLRWLADHLLQLAAREDIEELIGPAELDIGRDRDRVIGLQERIEQILDRDRRLLLDALSKLLARQHLLRREARSKLDDVPQAELSVPLVLKHDASVLTGHDEMKLIEVGLCVREHLVARFKRPREIAVGRVTDLRRPVAHDEHDLVAPAREFAQLAQGDRMTEVQVLRRRVKALLDTQLTLARSELVAQIAEHADAADRTRQEFVELFRWNRRRHGHRIGSEAVSIA